MQKFCWRTDSKTDWALDYSRASSESDDILIQRGIADKKCPEFHAVLYKFVMKSGENSSRRTIRT